MSDIADDPVFAAAEAVTYPFPPNGGTEFLPDPPGADRLTLRYFCNAAADASETRRMLMQARADVLVYEAALAALRDYLAGQMDQARAIRAAQHDANAQGAT